MSSENQRHKNNAGDEAMNSFMKRYSANRELVEEVNALITRFREEHKAMAEGLRAGLSSDEKQRIDRYNEMMGTIQSDLQEIRNSVTTCRNDAVGMLEALAGSRLQMSRELQAFLDEAKAQRRNSDELRLADFGTLMSNIKDYNTSLKREVEGMLESFASQHEQMSAGLAESLDKNMADRSSSLNSLLMGIRQQMSSIGNDNLEAARELRSRLDKGEADRMEAYRILFGRISSEVEELRASTDEMLKGFASDRIADSTGLSVDVPVAMEAPVVSAVEPPVAGNTGLGEAAEAESIDDAETTEAVIESRQEEVQRDVSLEERVLALINSSAGGLRVSEMEKPLGETRMKIGVAARNLLDAGKVLKTENYYHSLRN